MKRFSVRPGAGGRVRPGAGGARFGTAVCVIVAIFLSACASVPPGENVDAGVLRKSAGKQQSGALSVRPIDYTRDEPADSEGLQFVSGAAVDPAKKALAHAKAFGYAEKEENRIPSSIAAFEALASAPSYRPDLDLGWLAGSGEIVSFVGVWFDPVSRLAILEPVGTIPAYRRRRLAESLIEEGARRAAALGATALYVGSDQDFYRRIGFEVVLRQDVWEYRRK